MKVRDALLSDPRVVAPSAPVREAAELLARPTVESVLVADGERLIGVVTRASLVAAVARGEDLRAAAARDVADGDVPTIGPDEALDDALHRMGELDLERLPVVESGRLLGVLSREPILRRLAEDEPPADPDPEGTPVA